MTAHQITFTLLPPELTELVLRRLPLKSLRDLRSCARSIGMVPVHGLLKGLEMPLEHLNPGNLGSQQSTRGDRLKAMTGLTHLKLWSNNLSTRNWAYDGALPPQTALNLRLVLSEHVSCMQLLKSLHIHCVSVSAVASAAIHLHSTCLALSDLSLTRIFGRSSDWGNLWSALAGARSLRQLEISNFNVESSGDFDNIGSLDQLHSLSLFCGFPDMDTSFIIDTILLQVSRLTGITKVRAHHTDL